MTERIKQTSLLKPIALQHSNTYRRHHHVHHLCCSNSCANETWQRKDVSLGGEGAIFFEIDSEKDCRLWVNAVAAAAASAAAAAQAAVILERH